MSNPRYRSDEIYLDENGNFIDDLEVEGGFGDDDDFDDDFDEDFEKEEEEEEEELDEE
jgi:hypothetical protein